MLKVDSIEKRFGGLVALNNVSIHVEKGKIYGLIGPNGSGKSTLLNLVSGVLKPNAGKVYLNDVDVTGKSPHAITRLGLGRTFQIPRIFSELTVEENIIAVKHSSISNERTREILDLVELGEVRDVKAKMLGYGQRKHLELARAIALDTQLLFLDEPMAGLDNLMIAQISKQIRVLNQKLGKTMVIIEHNLEELMQLTDYVFVLDHGQKVEEGEPDKIRSSEIVHRAYFGS
ncbi:MAG TPA: ABC transporter ATP-binding protein [Terriglobales bacterium]|nr:ABC transporter ATP-binding protein [Terriglobales bacterium]